MERIKIGILGLNYNSNNFGCAALSFSFLKILVEIIEKTPFSYDLTFYDSIKSSLTQPLKIIHEQIRFSIFLYDKKNIAALKIKIKEEDLFFDFTAGDSFTDYYGLDRFIKRTFIKTLILICKKKLILGPQTYGPYKSIVAKRWAGYVIKNAFRVYARDGLSKERAETVGKPQRVALVTDVAFELDYNPDKYKELVNPDKLNLGVNLSGLLYCGGYTKDNQFELSVDYKKYCHSILEYLEVNKDKYNVWLIPHVVSVIEGFSDNDLIPIEAMKNEFDFVKVSPIFDNPRDAKAFISKMDIFTGARMHATIAAFSTGVVTIPFSYSVKFEGLYGELNYNYCINGKECKTEEAIKLTIDYINNYTVLKKALDRSIVIAYDKLKMFKKDIGNIIVNMQKEIR